MRVLFDTNVIIDAAVPDRAHHRVALQLLSRVDRGQITGLVTATSIATCWYVATAHYGVDPRPLFTALEETFTFAPMTRAALRVALEAPGSTDFEDLYLAAAGAEAGAACVVTRNEADFTQSRLTAYHPDELVAMLL
ncbi:MAG: PIN domain-containing protein [Bacteroidetes bacterium]|jgi:predicted nucleic acid-binding protein|nr:PIN domain-containing protein [Bacteroidota bacterium]